MSSKVSPSDLARAGLHFLWLLRDDVRQGRTIGDPEAWRRFLVWWVMVGRAAHTALGDPLPAEHRAWLAAPSAEVPQDAALPISRIMVEVWRWRDDLRAAFALDHADGRAAYVRWFVAHGLVEHDLASYLSVDQWTRLTTPGAGLAKGLEPLDSLHMAAWEGDPALRADFPIDRPDGRVHLRLRLEHGPPVPSDRLRRARAPAGPAAPAPPPARADGTVGVNLIGYAHGEFGVGEDVRMAARACEAAGIPFSVFDVPVRWSRHRAEDRRLAGLTGRDRPYPVNIFCMTGFDTANLLLEHGPALFEGRINIGYWPWELPEWPDPWIPAFDMVDEIWASSRFTQDALAAKAPTPVLHMPMAVEAAPAHRCDRRAFGLPEGRFLFLYTFDWNSYPARKNPAAVVAAFQAAFPDPAAPVGLVLKTMGAPAEDRIWLELSRLIAGDPRIGVINGVLDRDAVLGLCSVCDAVVSLHRAEGFGRTLAEAMLLERPVIATAWSGNMDFCTPDTAVLVPARLIPVQPGEYPHAEGMVWADPDHGAAVDALRLVAGDPGRRARLAGNARRLLEAQASPATVGQRYRRRLEALLARRRQADGCGSSSWLPPVPPM